MNMNSINYSYNPIIVKQVNTYQVKHILLWFGNVELHLIFNEEFES